MYIIVYYIIYNTYSNKSPTMENIYFNVYEAFGLTYYKTDVLKDGD